MDQIERLLHSPFSVNCMAKHSNMILAHFSNPELKTQSICDLAMFFIFRCYRHGGNPFYFSKMQALVEIFKQDHYAVSTEGLLQILLYTESETYTGLHNVVFVLYQTVKLLSDFISEQSMQIYRDILSYFHTYALSSGMEDLIFQLQDSAFEAMNAIEFSLPDPDPVTLEPHPDLKKFRFLRLNPVAVEFFVSVQRLLVFRSPDVSSQLLAALYVSCLQCYDESNDPLDEYVTEYSA